MKKYFYSLLCLICLVLSTRLNAQNTYFREGFSESAWPSTAAGAWVSLGTGFYISPSSGTWYTYGSYSTNGSTGACTAQTGDIIHLRTGNLNSVSGTSSTDSAFFVTPVVGFGINTITFYNGRAARRFTILKTTDTSATTTNWTPVTLVPATNAACDIITVSVADVSAKRIKIVARAGTDSDLDSLVMTSVNTIAPVKFGNVNASLVNGFVKLNWDILLEVNTQAYYIESSVDGRNFNYVGSLSASNSSKYSYVTNLTNASGNSYYRIKAVDKDGAVTYSNVLKLNTKKTDVEVNINPNPVKDGIINLQLSNFTKAAYALNLFDANGKKVFTKSITVENGLTSQAVEVGNTIAKGIYQLQVTNGNTNVIKTIMIQ